MGTAHQVSQTPQRIDPPNQFPQRAPVTFADRVALGTDVLAGVIDKFEPVASQVASYRLALQRNGVKGDTNSQVLLGWMLVSLGKMGKVFDRTLVVVTDIEQKHEAMQVELDALREAVNKMHAYVGGKDVPALSAPLQLTEEAFVRRKNARLKDVIDHVSDFKEN